MPRSPSVACSAPPPGEAEEGARTGGSSLVRAIKKVWSAPREYIKSALKAEAEGDEDFPGQKAALEASLNDVLLAKLGDTLAWSARDHV